MANPITWRNVNTPNFGAANQQFNTGAQTLGAGMDRMMQALGNYNQGQLDIQTQNKDVRTQNFLNQIQGLTDVNGYGALRSDITSRLSPLGQGEVDAAKVMSVLNGRQGQLQDRYLSNVAYQDKVTDINERAGIGEVRRLQDALKFDEAAELLKANPSGLRDSTIADLSNNLRTARRAEMDYQDGVDLKNDTEVANTEFNRIIQEAPDAITAAKLFDQLTQDKSIRASVAAPLSRELQQYYRKENTPDELDTYAFERMQENLQRQYTETEAAGQSKVNSLRRYSPETLAAWSEEGLSGEAGSFEQEVNEHIDKQGFWGTISQWGDNLSLSPSSFLTSDDMDTAKNIIKDVDNAFQDGKADSQLLYTSGSSDKSVIDKVKSRVSNLLSEGDARLREVAKIRAFRKVKENGGKWDDDSFKRAYVDQLTEMALATENLQEVSAAQSKLATELSNLKKSQDTATDAAYNNLIRTARGNR